MIEIFKTSVQNPLQAKVVQQLLLTQYPAIEVNFDLEDCDNILRIKNIEEASDIDSILKVLNETGIRIELLTD